MRRTFLSNALVNPPIEERIAPGGQSSSHVLNVVLEELRDEINDTRERVEQEIRRAAVDGLVERTAMAVLGATVTELRTMLATLVQSSRVIPISFRWLASPPSWMTASVSAGMYHAAYSLLSAPVLSSRSLVYDEFGMRRDMVLQAEPGSSAPGESSWLYTLGADDLVGQAWRFALPADDSSRWLRLRLRLAVGGFDELANLFWCQLLPGALFALREARVRSVSGQWHPISLSQAGWMTAWLADVAMHWDPRQTGAIDTIDLLLQRNGYPTGSGEELAVAVLAPDVRSVRFDRQGELTVSFQPARQPLRCDYWRVDSYAGGLRFESAANGFTLRVGRRNEWYSPMLRGLTLYL